MNKKNLIRKAAAKAGLSVKDEQRAVDSFLAAISESLKAEKSIVIPDFGRFSVYERKARKVRHPQTGEIVDVPAMKHVRFKAFGNVANYGIKYGK